MPPDAWLARVRTDVERLTRQQQATFLVAVEQFVEDLQRDRRFRKGLRVKGIRGAPGVFEMTWAPDGRATFQFDDEVIDGEAHIVWRRVGTHDSFTGP